MFALNRKALGRSLNKAVPVSAVGIFSYDGAQVSSGPGREPWARVQCPLQGTAGPLGGSSVLAAGRQHPCWGSPASALLPGGRRPCPLGSGLSSTCSLLPQDQFHRMVELTMAARQAYKTMLESVRQELAGEPGPPAPGGSAQDSPPAPVAGREEPHYSECWAGRGDCASSGSASPWTDRWWHKARSVPAGLRPQVTWCLQSVALSPVGSLAGGSQTLTAGVRGEVLARLL